MITIVDYKMGNLGSIVNMLNKIGAPAITTSSPEVIEKADKLILPGVGAFDAAMENLSSLGLIEVLNKKVLLDKTPVLGLCVGLQIMTRQSAEGRLNGLSWLDAECKKFHADHSRGIKVPQMGWNLVKVKRANPFIDIDQPSPRFYFVHSYYIQVNDPTIELATTEYGVTYSSGLWRENIAGFQFHPEKSHRFGIELFKNFVRNF